MSPPSLSPLLCSQSAVVSAPYRRWVEKLSWETKRTEEERQVGSEEEGEGLGNRRTFVGRGWATVSVGLWKAAVSSAGKEQRGSGHAMRMESAGPSADWWSRRVYEAHLGPVWSGSDGRLFLLCSSLCGSFSAEAQKWHCRADVLGKKKRSWARLLPPLTFGLF